MCLRHQVGQQRAWGWPAGFSPPPTRWDSRASSFQLSTWSISEIMAICMTKPGPGRPACVFEGREDRLGHTWSRRHFLSCIPCLPRSSPPGRTGYPATSLGRPHLAPPSKRTLERASTAVVGAASRKDSDCLARNPPWLSRLAPPRAIRPERCRPASGTVIPLPVTPGRISARRLGNGGKLLQRRERLVRTVPSEDPGRPSIRSGPGAILLVSCRPPRVPGRAPDVRTARVRGPAGSGRPGFRLRFCPAWRRLHRRPGRGADVGDACSKVLASIRVDDAVNLLFEPFPAIATRHYRIRGKYLHRRLPGI